MSSTELTLRLIAQSPILSCTADITVAEAARRMNADRCSCIVVVADGQPVGIWTERDALALDFSRPESLALPIGQVMSRPVKTIAADLTLKEATLRFKEEGVRHFLVEADGECLGVVSQSDIVLNQGIEYYLRLREVRSVMKARLVTVPAAVPLGAAAAEMRRRGVDAVAVRFPGGEHGILTERDVVRNVGLRRVDLSAGEAASRPLLAVSADSSLFSARNLLADKHFRHLGVTDGAHGLVGILTFADILSSIEQEYVLCLEETLRQREEALTLSRGKLRLAGQVFETTHEGIMITDAAGIIQSVNPAFCRMTGYGQEELVGRSAKVLNSGRHEPEFFTDMWARIRREGYWRGEVWNRRKDGHTFLKTTTITGIRDKGEEYAHFAAVFADVVSAEANDERLDYLANNDQLTGLPNRSRFTGHLKYSVQRAKRGRESLAVMIADIDRLKSVNDTLGYNVGDAVIQAVAQRLALTLPEGSLAARLAGDEFGIILDAITGEEDGAHIAQQLIDAVQAPLIIEGNEIYVTASIGISVFPADAEDHHALLMHASSAAGHAKERGVASFRFYTAETDSRARRRLTLETNMRRGLERDEFTVHYQPKIDLRTGRISGMEALMRWISPDLGSVPPSQFIPVAEETGLIHPLGELVLRKACLQTRAWSARLPGLRVAVNLSCRQFQHSRSVVQLVGAALDESGLASCQLELEITESMAMDNADHAIQTLRRLDALGVTLSIDDFGTGYSSLQYLKRLPIQALKIDQSFIRDIDATQAESAIPAAIISLGRSLGLTVIAEGVESSTQLDVLVDLGCDTAQGYYFSRPLPPEDFERYCRSNDNATVGAAE